MARFWWGDKGDDRKIHWVAWEKLCTTKFEGGLGFQDMSLFNMALLAKQGWRLIRQPNSLLAQVLKARYYPSESFMEVEVVKGCSFTWRSILKGRELLKKGLRFQFGNGESISVWDDPWIPLPYSFRLYSLPMEDIEELRVYDLIDPDTGDWNVWLLNELFMGNEVDNIAQIALSNGVGEDRMVWHFDNKGLYSVKSGYHVARMTNQQGNITSTSDSNSGTKALYKRIWGSIAPPKVRMHAWRLVRGILPTRCALNKRVLHPDVRCVFCESRNVEEVIEWAAIMLDKLTKEQAARVLMALWVIWDTRNDVLWNRGSYDLGHMQRKAKDLFMEYQNSMVARQRRESHKRGGIGVVVRNEHGVRMAALAQPLEYAHTALQVEAEALRARILIAIHQAWEMVEIESDCSMLVDDLHRDEDDLSTVDRIVEDCRSLDELWFDEVSVITRDALLENGCNVVKGLGNKSPLNDLFGERYGESFVDTAVKLLPGNLVNPIFKKNIIALSPPDSAVPTDVIVKHKPVKPSFTSSSPDQAPARLSEQKKDDEVQCPKHVHPKLPDWDDIYTQFSALKKPKYVSPKLPDIAAKINALKIPKNENTADNYQLQLQYHEDHGSVDDEAIFNFHGCQNSIEIIEFGIQQYCY
ncbi:hypothetical protein ACLB2K_063335 [Fragaria x ananassa]